MTGPTTVRSAKPLPIPVAAPTPHVLTRPADQFGIGTPLSIAPPSIVTLTFPLLAEMAIVWKVAWGGRVALSMALTDVYA